VRAAAAGFFRRLGWAAVTLWGVTLVAFVVVYRIPADPALVLAGPRADPAVVANIRSQLHLDRPAWVQYGEYLARLARLDLGESYVRKEPVARSIERRLPATILLAVTGWLCWLAGGITFGVWAAARPSRVREAILLTFSILGASTPTFWAGMVLLFVGVSCLHWFPAGGSGTLKHLVLPAAALSLSGIAFYSRFCHSTLTEVLREDYVRTARAKGVGPRGLLVRHALRNAMLPLVTVAGSDLAALMGGVVFTETVFDWKGLGQLAVESVGTLDIPMILGVVLVSAVFVIVANMLVDLCYPLLDPRVQRS
jgi:peptide/nickel transport system permease protein